MISLFSWWTFNIHGNISCTKSFFRGSTLWKLHAKLPTKIQRSATFQNSKWQNKIKNYDQQWNASYSYFLSSNFFLKLWTMKMFVLTLTCRSTIWRGFWSNKMSPGLLSNTSICDGRPFPASAFCFSCCMNVITFNADPFPKRDWETCKSYYYILTL